MHSHISSKHITLIIFTLTLAYAKVMCAQDIGGYRLIGTSTAMYEIGTGWEFTDSSRYVYNGSGLRHDTRTQYYQFNGAENLLPLSLNFEAPYSLTGPFPGLINPINEMKNPWRFDSLFIYATGYSPDISAWTLMEWKYRTYWHNSIDYENHVTSAGSIRASHVTYNKDAQPIKYLVTQGVQQDTSIFYEFNQSDAGLLDYNRMFSSDLYNTHTVFYSLDNEGKPLEELVWAYRTYFDYSPYLYEKWTFEYNQNDHVTRLQRLIPDEGNWFSTYDYQFTLDGDKPTSSLLMYRPIDTLSIPTIIGEWDTVSYRRIFYSEGLIDSVITQWGYTHIPMQNILNEYYQYSDNHLISYDIVTGQDNTINKIQNQTFTYNESGQLTSTTLKIDFVWYCSQIDSSFIYDDVGNVILKEVQTGLSYTTPCNTISTSPEARYYYYYEPVRFFGLNSGNLLMHVFPNPAGNFLHIQLENPFDNLTDIHLRIMNATGQTVYNKKIDGNTTFQVIDCSTWSSGMYILQALQGEELVLQPVIVR